MATKKPAPQPEPEETQAPPSAPAPTPAAGGSPILPGCSEPNIAPPSVGGTSQDPTRKET